MSDNELTRHDHILMQLVFTLQTAAMQQMGKIQNPVTGDVEKDLEQARSSIDVLEMLKVKCRTDTPEDLLRMLDTAVMNLQLTYMDEVKRDRAAAETTADKSDAPDDETSSADETEATAESEQTDASEPNDEAEPNDEDDDEKHEASE